MAKRLYLDEKTKARIGEVAKQFNLPANALLDLALDLFVKTFKG